ncbi:MAG: hypothetical protein K0R34_4344 [Herbinix sp.]|nr:hypothetical protein [Herbinix sp.]
MKQNDFENTPDHLSLGEKNNTFRLSKINDAFLSAVHRKPLSRGFQFRLLLLILLIAGASTLLINGNAKADTSIQEGIAQKVLRFHVIANSDTEEDQKLKLTVKETLVESLTPRLIHINDITKVKAIVTEQLDTIRETAAQVIQQQGYDYNVTVSLEKCYFPLKTYGNYAFPPGYYEALRVRIGKAEGKNWWCVMFPPLCFVDETYSIVDENSKEKLLTLLTEDEYDALISGKTPVKVRSKLVEYIKELFQ